MGQTVKLRRSAISGKIPINSQLQLGELSMNTTDGKIFLSKSGSNGPSVEEVIITNTQNFGSIDIVGSISGSFLTGSFIGDGSGLYNIPATGVTGLSLDRIASSTSTASIDADGLHINTDTTVTGSLTATEFTGSGLGLTNVPIKISGSDEGSTSIDSTFTRIKFDDSTGIKISGTTGGDAVVYLSGVASESDGGEGKTAKLEVTSATSTWTLNHNLNEKHPSIEVFDSNDEVIIPQKIEATSVNQVVVSFASPQTGTVTATVGGGLPSIDSGYENRVLSVGGNGIATWKTGILSGSIDFSTLVDTGSFNTYTSSNNNTNSNQNGRLDSLEEFTSSIDDTYATDTDVTTLRTDLNTYTSSTDGRLDSLEVTSGSHDGRLDRIETSTSSLNSFTSSINTTIKGKLNNDGVISGSIQIDHDATTNYVGNEHIDHSSITIGSGKGLTGGGTIDTNRSLTLDTGSVHFLSGIKSKLNAETVVSGSEQINITETTNYNLVDGRLDSIESFTSSIDDTYATDADVTTLRGDLNTYTSSNDTLNSTQDGRLDSLESNSGSYLTEYNDEYTTGATFGTSNGIVTFTRNDGDQYTVDLDGRYLTSFTETDPIFTAHAVYDITSTQIGNWDTAYGWGDHSQEGYLTTYNNEYTTGATFNGSNGIITFTRNDGDTYTLNISSTLTDINVTGGTYNDSTQTLRLNKSNGTSIDVTGFAVDTVLHTTGATFNSSDGVVTFTKNGGDTYTVDLDGRYLTSFTETDPIFTASPSAGITETNITNWDSAYTYSTVGHLPLSGGTITGDVVFLDSNQLRLGTGSDLRLWHNGTNSYVFNYNGDLNVGSRNGDLKFLGSNGSTGEDTYFFLDGSQQNVNFQKDAIFTDNKKVLFGGSGDLQMYHDGTNSYIKDNGTGVLNIQGSTVLNIGGTNGEVGIQYTENAGVTLRHNNVVKFTTDSTGVSVTGIINATGGNSSQWNTAYGWGDHGSAGYLTSYNDEYTTGATFNTSNGVITFTRNDGDTFNVDIDNRYLPLNGGTISGTLTISSASDGHLILKQTDAGSVSGTPEGGWNYMQFYDAQNDRQGYFGIDSSGNFLFNPEVSGAEVRMNRTLRVSSNIISTGTITASGGNSGNWNTAYGWGDHSQEGYLTSYNDEYTTGATFNSGNGIVTFTRNDGDTFTVDLDGRYLTSFTETDPIFTASPSAGITDTNISNWNTAYGWGDHSQEGYITSFTDTNEFTTGATFNSTTGIITFTRNNGGDTFTVDIDGKYLPLSGGTITGDLEIKKTDPKLIFFDSSGANGTPNGEIVFSELDGYENFKLRYNGTNDRYEYWALIGNVSTLVGYWNRSTGTSLHSVGSISTGTDGNSTQWNTAYGWGDHSTEGYLTSYNDEYTTGVTWTAGTATLTFTRNDGDTYNVQMLETLTDVTVTGGTYASGTQILTLTKSDGSTVDVSGFAIDTDVNWYTTGATFNTGNGVITGTRSDGGTWTVDIDNRYLQLGGGTLTGNLTLNSTNPEILFNGTSDAGVDMAIKATPEGLDFYEPEDSNKIHFQILDDTGVNAAFGLQIGGTQVLSSGRVLSNVTGNISMFTNDSNYLTSFTETDPIFTASPSAGITDTNISNWNTAYGWGDHASAGYVTSSGNTVIGTDSDINTSGSYVVDQLTMTDGVITSHSTRQLSELKIPDTRAAEKTPNEYTDQHLSLDFTDDFGSLGSWYSGITLKGWTGTYAAWQLISEADSGIGDTNLYFRQGNNTTWQSMRTVWTSANFANNSSQWNTAYGWGDHSTEGYITGYSEVDTLATVTSRGSSTTTSVRFSNDLNYFGKSTGNNEGEIVINTGIAGSPQIGFTEHGDASWAIGIDDADNSFKIHGTATNTIPEINGLAIPLFEVTTTAGVAYLNDNRIHHAGDFTTTDVANGVTAYGWGDHSVEGYLTSESYTAHEDTSTLNGNYGGGNNGIVVEDITVDSNGHVTAVGTRDLDGRFAPTVHDHHGTYMKTNRTLTSINTIDNGGDRYDPSADNPTNEHYAVLTYGNGGNVTGQLATHFVTGDLYSRGYNSTWSTWKKYFNTDDFTTTNVSNWNTAYGWGDHSVAGYLTSYSETDTLSTVTARGRRTHSNGSDVWNATTPGLGEGNIHLMSVNTDHAGGAITFNASDANSAQAGIYVKSDGSYGTKMYIATTDSYSAGSKTAISIDHNGLVNITRGNNRLQVNGNRVHHAGDFTTTDVANGVTAYGWGDHSLAGYTGDQDLSGYATETYVGTQIDNLIASAPGTLDTLNELAAALGDDPNFATTITTSIATKLPLSGGTLTGDLTVGSTARASDTVIKALSDDSHKSGFEAYGSGQGNGYLYVGQSTTHGGGISYNGDSSPAYVGGETSDYITFYRREAGTNTEVFAFPYSNNNVYFNGEVHSGGGNSTQWNTAVGWGDHSLAGYTGDQDLSGYLLNTTDTFAGNLTFNGGNNTSKESFLNVKRGSGAGLWLKFQTDSTSANDVSQFVIRRSTDNVDILSITATSGNLSVPGTLSASGYNDSNWNTAYGWGDHSGVYLPIGGKAADSDKLDGIDSGTFMRRDTNVTLASGSKFTFHSGGGGTTFGNNHYSMGVDIANTGWSSPNYSDLIIGYHTGIRIGAAYGGTRFYNNSPTTDTDNTGNGNGNEGLIMTVGGVAGSNSIIVEGTVTASGGNSGNWNSAYGWGNHANAGYITSPNGGNADTLDSLDSTQFLRSDTADSFTGTITMGTQKALVANNYGRGVYGLYSASRYQHVWSMGTSYNLSDDGTTSGNLYGLAFTHTNVGGQSKSGLAHQLLIMDNGVTKSAIGRGIWTDGTITTTSHGTSADWKTAYGWGDHASGGYASSSHTHAASDITSGTFAAARFATSTRYNIGLITGYSSQSRDKLRVWDSSEYSIGMKSGYDYGHIGSGEYAMSFQMSNTDGRGWWWGDTSHTDDQGAASLTTQGKMVIAKSLSIGEGELITNPSDTPLYVEGTTSGETVFEVQGTSGQLFSITDSLIGDIFEVSDISGIPILTVNSSGVVTVDDTLRVTGDVIAYYASDKRLKDNIKPIENAIDKIKMIGGYEFDWNSNSRNNNGHDVGVIAQEIEEVLPELVGTRGDGYKGVKYEKLTALLIQSNKELIARVEELESKLKK